jgi:uncharacterized membrane protein YraQ (UPF0718 family)
MAEDENRNANGAGAATGRILDRGVVAFAALAVASGAAVYVFKGAAVFFRALDDSFDLLLVVAPRVFAALLLAGFIQVLISRDMVARWIGERSGVGGIVIAAAAGALTPGGPLTAFPIAVALAASGAARGTLVAYITAWAMLGVQRMMVWEIPFMGTDFALLRVTCVAALPVLAGMLAQRIPVDIKPPPGAGD